MRKCKQGHEIIRGKCHECYMERASERFWSKVEMVDGHGLWRGEVNHEGYGKFGLGYGRWMMAHRFAWQDKNGPIPEGKEMGHTCEFKHCVLHVRPVTHRQNILERYGWNWEEWYGEDQGTG